MIARELDNFLGALIKGDKNFCSKIVSDFVKKGVPIESIYEDLIKTTLYKVGELWENGKISIATEHLASAIIESILNDVYSEVIVCGERANRNVVVATVENEYHQIGIKMVADIFEKFGWNTYFLGANTPAEDLLSFIKDIKPEMVALSMSINIRNSDLDRELKSLRERYSYLTIIIGGQGFISGEDEIFKKYPDVTYIKDLYELETFIRQ